jgi:hypothetical protein
VTYDRAVNKVSRCVVILSSKSSGSSALQRLLCSGTNARHIEHTRHAESETLYWTKAASILGMPQLPLLDSEVPIPAPKARKDLITLLAQNAPEFSAPADARTLVLEGWRALCMHYSPVFVEKSPHHIHQWSCLELMADAASRMPEIDFRFIGLVRNPMDALYSTWSRWRLPPQKIQFEWLEAHQNLLRFKDLVGARMTVVRYESLAADDGVARELLRSLEIEGTAAGAAALMHGNSMLKWKRDPRYGFELDSRVAALAAEFGYTRDELTNHSSYRWTLHHMLTRAMHLAWFRPIQRARASLRRVLRRPQGGPDPPNPPSAT